MKQLKNQADAQALEKVTETEFVQECTDEFLEKSLALTNARKVRVLSIASILPNILSAITAGFFVLYLLSGYRAGYAYIIGALLIFLVLALEIGKRLLIQGTANTWFVEHRLPVASIAALVLIMGASMGASYQGGNALVVETAPPPPRPHNAQIDSLNLLLQAELATIDRLQRTTWKGKVTQDAVKGINASKKVQSALVDRIAALEAQDDEAHAGAVEKHTAKHMNFGLLLGIMAALADVFLLGMLWTAKRLKYQVAAISISKAETRTQEEQQEQQSAADAVQAAISAGIEAIQRATQQAVSAAQSAYNQPPAYQQLAPANIGFVRRDTPPAEVNPISNPSEQLKPVATTSHELQTLLAAYKNAKSNLDAWKAKPDTWKSKPANLQKWSGTMAELAEKIRQAGGNV